MNRNDDGDSVSFSSPKRGEGRDEEDSRHTGKFIGCSMLDVGGLVAPKSDEGGSMFPGFVGKAFWTCSLAMIVPARFIAPGR